MKQFRCPNGIRPWNSPKARRDTRVIYKEIFEQHCYEKHGITVADGDVVFDIGSHIGMFTLSLMERFRNLQLYCFEPIPNTHACLTRNLAESPQRAKHELTVVNAAVGGSDSETTIEFFPEVPGISTLYSVEKRQEFGAIVDGIQFADIWMVDPRMALFLLPIYPWRRRVLRGILRKVFSKAEAFPCTVRTLSNIVRALKVQRIDLLKIDVEGAEIEVLAGIEDEYWALIRQISMEVEPMNKRHLPALSDRLRSLGFMQVAIEGLLDKRNPLDERGPCTLYALRAPRFPKRFP